MVGTSIEDLELPEPLIVTVRTAVTPQDESTQDFGNPDEEVITDDMTAAPEWRDVSRVLKSQARIIR